MTDEELKAFAQANAQADLDAHMSGPSADSVLRRERHMSDQMGFVEKLGHGTNVGNLAYSIGKTATVNIGSLFEADPNFSTDGREEEIRTSLPPQMWNRAMDAQSETELQALYEVFKDEKLSQSILRQGGFSNGLATILPMMVDVDAAMMFVSGGSYLGPKMAQGAAALTGYRSGRAASIGYGVGAAAEAGLISEVGLGFTQSDYDAATLQQIAYGSLFFGGGIGALTRMERMANKRTRELLDEVQVQKHSSMFSDNGEVILTHGPLRAAMEKLRRPKTEEAPTATPREDEPTTTWVPEEDTKGSIGARKIKATYGVQLNKATEEITDASFEQLEALGWNALEENRTKWQKGVDKFEDALNKLPWLKTDQDIALQSKSPTMQLLGLLTMESASGRARLVNNTGAVLRERYLPGLVRNVAVSNDMFKAYAKARNLPVNRDTRLQFERDTRNEMYARYIDGRGAPDVDPQVKLYADAMDADFKDALDLLKKADVYGADRVEWKSGWMPQRWSGEKLLDMMQSGRIANEQIEEALMSAYRKVHPDWSPKALKATSKMLMTRMLALEEGLDTNLYRVLEQDGRAFLTEGLMNNGLTKREAERLIEGLEGRLEKRGKAKILKSRTEIDPRTNIPGTNLTILDLMRDDLDLVNLSYARSAAGFAALAESTGGAIRSKADFDLFKSAIQNEVQAFGGKALPEGYLDHIWAHFSGASLSGDTSPWIKRAVQVSNLALLNQMGLTQAAETGMIVAANGWEAFTEAVPLWKDIMKHPDQYTQVLKELVELGLPIQGEHLLIRNDKMLDDIRVAPTVNSIRARDPEALSEVDKFLEERGQFDNMLMTGQRIQGYLSGFYHVRHAQHYLQSRAFLQSFGRHIKGQREITPERLRDMGFVDDGVYDAVKRNWMSHVEYGEDGIVKALNLHKWDAVSVNNFASVMQRALHQNVQKGLIGETAMWQSQGLGSLMANLRTFTLTGLKKQSLRHARVADGQSVAAVLYGVPLAGMIYAARQLLNNKTENLTSEKIVKGAIGYSNVTAPIPMLTDPFSALLGLDQLQFGMYGSRDFTGQYDFVPGIPAFETMNRLGRLPSSLWGLASGNGRPSDITNLQAVPFGNMLGVNAIFNGMKDEIRETRRKEREAEKKAKKKEQKTKSDAPTAGLNIIEAVQEFTDN